MPAKYSHVKKRSASGLLKKTSSTGYAKHAHHTQSLNPNIDRSISQSMTAASQLERTIARIILIRYEQDIARLFSTRLYNISLLHLPTFVMRCISLCGPSWLMYNHDCDEIKDFFRAAISMDMRQAGERVATKSVLWSYTALRHFAMSNNVAVCAKRGLHSLRLLPYYPALKAHLDALKAMPLPSFSKPPHLGSIQEGQEALEDACELKYGLSMFGHPEWDGDWHVKVRTGYERLSQTLWHIAREFDVHGYGAALREKLTTKWCDCGCSTDHLGEVCEQTVREDEEESGVRLGKQREWDGRGNGLFGWDTEEEEDIWEIEMDFGGMDPDENGVDSEMTVGELMEWRYLKAEREKEQGNVAFRRADYEVAVRCYETAHNFEPELPHYQLNLAAAHIKLSNWVGAENACTKALSQHRSSKGYYRRARARRMLNRPEEAIKDLRSALKLHPTNWEAVTELASLIPPDDPPQVPTPVSSSSSSKQPAIPSAETDVRRLERLGIVPPKLSNPPSFVRTKADDRKLKIMPALASLAEPPNYGRAYQPSCTHPHHQSLRGKKERKAKTGAASNAKTRELEEILRSEAVTYPSWDRYIMKRVD